MPIYKTKGIVIKNWPLSEADKIVVIYTPNYGKITGVAKGVRKTKSKFGSSMEVFTYAEFVLYGQNKDNHLEIITQAEIISSFQEIREDLAKIIEGSFILELIDTLVSGKEMDRPIFNLFLSTLVWLKEETTELISLVFPLKLLALLGMGLQLGGCVLCQQTSSHYFRFNPAEGGVLCGQCGGKGGVSISAGVIGVMNQFLRLDLKKVKKIQIAPNLMTQLQQIIIDSYLNYHLDAPLKSRQFIPRKHETRPFS